MTQLVLNMGGEPVTSRIDPVEACRWVPMDGPVPRPAAFLAYWHWMGERMRVFYARLAGEPRPWTRDPVLQKFKFCNAYRVLDRLSQLAVSSIYEAGASMEPRDIVLRVLLFRFFNRAETWEVFRSTFGHFGADDFARNVPRFKAALDSHLASGGAVFGNAYMHAPVPGASRKHHGYLDLLAKMVASGVADAIVDAPSARAVYEVLTSYPMIGRFVGYQLLADLGYSPVVGFDEDDFTVAGPGAVAGIKKCFESTRGMTPEEVISWMVDHQSQGLRSAGYDPESAWLPGRRFKKIDVQNGFCEAGKYLRVYLPGLDGGDGRTQIKARFGAGGPPIAYAFPPKWGIKL